MPALPATRFWHRMVLAFIVSAAFGCGAQAQNRVEQLKFHRWAETPPMGWNSWDCFATTVTEAQARAHADYMAEHLAAFGWEYIVVDIQWYEPGATGYNYRRGAELEMDDWGRLLPAPNRFPSSTGGVGFKAVGDYIHDRGLKFGLHLMRGIPRQAVAANTPIKGTSLHAGEIANTASICPWNPDMYGVDMSKPGAQEYYDSVFELIASWGVDYVKVDDISRPYHDHEAEIEAVRAAIDRTGRPMVLSLSPGETALTAAEHVARNANLWRISDDFWDNWPALYAQFARLENWNAFRGPGYWPDADMLPFGVIDLGRRTTRFTPAEQRTVMSLWSIARSPLMHGGDMTMMDDFTLSLLTNNEVIAVNQHSASNRPLFNHDDLIAWVADAPDSPDKYLAVFNARDPVRIEAVDAVLRSEIVNRRTPGQRVPIEADITGGAKLVLVVDDAGDGNSWDHAIWVEPRLVAADGVEKKLTELEWVSASAGWGEVSTEHGPSGRPMRVAGQPVTYGIGAHAQAMIEYDLPPGFTQFRADGALDDATMSQTMGGTLRFRVHVLQEGDFSTAAGLPIEVDLAQLGFEGPCTIRDLWTHQDLGEFSGTFAPEIAWHASGLYRVSPVAE